MSFRGYFTFNYHHETATTLSLDIVVRAVMANMAMSPAALKTRRAQSQRVADDGYGAQ